MYLLLIQYIATRKHFIATVEKFIVQVTLFALVRRYKMQTMSIHSQLAHSHHHQCCDALYRNMPNQMMSQTEDEYRV